MRQYYGVRDDEMELLPLAVDMTMARRARQERQGAALRAQLGIPEGAIVAFTGGKFHALKRTELAIEATATLSRLSVHLIIVGEGDKGQPDYAQWLMELARATPNVHLLGWQDRAGVFRAMNAADLAVFPASQSVLWQQAIGMGLPLVVGDLGGQDPSYLNTHDNLVILRGDEISASRIGHEIERIGNNRNVRAAMSAGALRFADDYLDWDKLVRRVLRFNTALG